MDKDKENQMQELPVPFKVYEAEIRRGEKRIIRHIVLEIALAVLVLLGSLLVYLNNQRWIKYIEQYDFSDYSYQQDGEGVNIIGDRNGVDFFEPETESSDTNEKEL